jgi:hypothetical protein
MHDAFLSHSPNKNKGTRTNAIILDATPHGVKQLSSSVPSNLIDVH